MHGYERDTASCRQTSICSATVVPQYYNPMMSHLTLGRKPPAVPMGADPSSSPYTTTW